MTFVLRMAWRETRAAWRRLLFFFLCIAIGVGAIAALRSIIQNVRGVLVGQARTLIAADIVVSSAQPWTDAARNHIAAALDGVGPVIRAETIETATMARPADPAKPLARMVEVRGIDAAFPLYGSIDLAGGRRYSHALLEHDGVLVRPELLTQLDVAVGDGLVIGNRTFTIRGVIENEPGRRVGGFSLGPRVIIDRDAVGGAGLLTFGSRARYQILLRVEERRVERLVAHLKAQFRNTFIGVRSFRTTEDDLGDDLLRAENYLSLVGLIVVVLGGIGISSVTRVFLEQKLRSIAVLKCLGAGTRQVLAVYVVQVSLLGLAGSLAGLGLGRIALAAAPDQLGAGPSALPLSHALTPAAMLQAIGIGVLIALLFSLVPLLRVRHVRPSLLLRHEESRASGIDWVRYGVTALVVVAVVGLAAWQAASLRVGMAVGIGFGIVVFLLYAAGWLLVRLTARLDRVSWFPVRHAALHLHRPGNQTRLVLLAVGLGAFFIVGIRAVQVNLLREMAVDVGEDTPDMFLIDIQEDQAPGVHAMLRQRTGHDPRVIPVLRARITQVRGRETSLDTIEDIRGRGSLAREYTLTYRPRLERNEQIVAGRFWDGTPSDKPEVSIEESIRERFKIDVGDTIQFTVLGQPIDATVTSVRHVNWRDSRAGGFMFVFRPGVLEDAPHWYIAPVRGPADVGARARLQRDLVVAYPNVSVIDVREVLETVRGVVSNVTLGIAAVGGLVLFTGIVILVGAVAMTKFRRVYEAAILKTLGASARLVGAVLVLEYGILGTLAGIIGALAGSVLGWAVTRYVIQVPWRLPLGDVLASVVITAALVAVVGLLASADVLRGKPLATLRAE